MVEVARIELVRFSGLAAHRMATNAPVPRSMPLLPGAWRGPPRIEGAAALPSVFRLASDVPFGVARLERAPLGDVACLDPTCALPDQNLVALPDVD